MTKRWSRAGVLIALAAVTLAGCRTNVGVAARVNGETISESTVTDQLSGKPPSAELAQQASAAGQELTPARAIVLQYEIERRLYENALRKNGGIPDEGRLTSLRQRAVAAFLGNGQDISTAALGQRLSQFGVKTSFAKRLVRTLETEYALGLRVGGSKLESTVRQAGIKVSISPRYGSWDAQRLAVVGTGNAGLPDFLKIRRPATGSGSGDTGSGDAGGTGGGSSSGG